MKNHKSNLPYKTLKIDGNHDNFETFYDKNKKIIYDSIFDTLLGFTIKNTIQLTLFVSSNIQNRHWETSFNFNRNDLKILKRDLMPFYEQTEDYEMCKKIGQLYDNLNLSH